MITGARYMTKYLFDTFSEIEERIRTTDKIVLFLDYDGTLVSFNNNAMGAMPSDKLINLLGKIIENSKVKTFIITGRNRERMKKLMWIKDLDYICCHGYEMGFPEFSIEIDEKDKEIIKRIFSELEEEFSDKISDMNMKGDIGINFNYRPYKGNHEEVRRRFIEIVKKHDPHERFRIMQLSEAFNLIPKVWDKGKAADYVLTKHAPEGSLPVYFGDDTTDEDAFRILKNKGITVYVKNQDKRKTDAEFFVNDPGEVLASLQKLFI